MQCKKCKSKFHSIFHVQSFFTLGKNDKVQNSKWIVTIGEWFTKIAHCQHSASKYLLKVENMGQKLSALTNYFFKEFDQKDSQKFDNHN